MRFCPVAVVFGLAFLGLMMGCSSAPSGSSSKLVGAWRSKVQFSTGAFAAVKDLEFLMVFHAGGTMNESSNYDSSPPVPPAYGTWKQSGENKYSLTYMFYQTAPPKDFKDIAGGGGWTPGGYGIVKESVELAADGNSFESTIEMQMYDTKDKPIGGAEKATARGKRMD